MIKLDKRLETISRFVRPDKVVADIGTDHALLPCYLKQRGQKRVIASDINPNPLKTAERTLLRENVTGVELVLSDGLKNIDYAEDIIIAGMGGETILGIVNGLFGRNFLNNDLRLILQPMTRHSELRKGLYSLGFEILNEASAYSGNKIYTVIHAAYTGKCRDIDEISVYFGKQHDICYIKSQIKKIKNKIPADSNYIKLAEEAEELLRKYETEKNI